MSQGEVAAIATCVAIAGAIICEKMIKLCLHFIFSHTLVIVVAVIAIVLTRSHKGFSHHHSGNATSTLKPIVGNSTNGGGKNSEGVFENPSYQDIQHPDKNIMTVILN